MKTILQALQHQIAITEFQQSQGLWVPNWKNPANWLSEHCWKDELPTDTFKEKKHAIPTTTARKSNAASDMFGPPRGFDFDEEERCDNNNVLTFKWR